MPVSTATVLLPVWPQSAGKGWQRLLCGVAKGGPVPHQRPLAPHRQRRKLLVTACTAAAVRGPKAPADLNGAVVYYCTIAVLSSVARTPRDVLLGPLSNHFWQHIVMAPMCPGPSHEQAARLNACRSKRAHHAHGAAVWGGGWDATPSGLAQLADTTAQLASLQVLRLVGFDAAESHAAAPVVMRQLTKLSYSGSTAFDCHPPASLQSPSVRIGPADSAGWAWMPSVQAATQPQLQLLGRPSTLKLLKLTMSCLDYTKPILRVLAANHPHLDALCLVMRASWRYDLEGLATSGPVKLLLQLYGGRVLSRQLGLLPELRIDELLVAPWFFVVDEEVCLAAASVTSLTLRFKEAARRLRALPRGCRHIECRPLEEQDSALLSLPAAHEVYTPRALTYVGVAGAAERAGSGAAASSGHAMRPACWGALRGMIG